jgi:hypothetical protein
MMLNGTVDQSAEIPSAVYDSSSQLGVDCKGGCWQPGSAKVSKGSTRQKVWRTSEVSVQA